MAAQERLGPDDLSLWLCTGEVVLLLKQKHGKMVTKAISCLPAVVVDHEDTASCPPQVGQWLHGYDFS
jgi:hypothetical protein